VDAIASVISVVIVLGLPAAWLISELLDARKSVRVGLGLAVIVAAAGLLITAEEIVRFQNGTAARCFRQISVLLDKGDVDTVKRAVVAYNEGGTLSALATEQILYGQDGQQ
jgi:hypothetical protein